VNGSSAPHTNLVYFSVDGAEIGDPTLDAIQLSARLQAQGILANPIGVGERKAMMRMATHLDVTEKDIDQTIAALRSCMRVT
jgi:threonine aldolase